MTHPSTKPKFIETEITVLRTPDGTGNAFNGKYNVIYEKAELLDHTPNAIFNFRLADQSPPEIRFVGMQVAGQSSHLQLSEPSVSVDGRMITFSDANTEKVKMNITFKWRDYIEFDHDPIIGNGGGS